MADALAAAAVANVERRRLVALSLPVVVPIAMNAVFTIAGDRFGQRAGYLVGFGVYWAVCGALSVAVLDRHGVRRLFRDARPRLARPAGLGAVLLLWPPAGAIATRLIPDLGDATSGMVATAVAVGLVNATLEEVFWRGVYVTLWPRNPWLGWVWPAIGFGAWHLAPQVIHPSALGPLVYVVSATALGLSWGWVAWRTGSLRWVTVSHVFTDGSGIRNALFFIGP
jgi:membrane protease YdiL (CAAX protease family)